MRKSILDFKYSTIGIVIFILIISLIFTLLGTYFATNKIFDFTDYDTNHTFLNKLSDEVMESLHLDSYAQMQSDYLLDYYLRFDYISNYNRTEEYVNRVMNNMDSIDIDSIDAIDIDGNYSIDEFEFAEYKRQLRNNNLLEEPIHKVKKNTNISSPNNTIDPQKLKLNNPDYINVKGFYENGVVNFEAPDFEQQGNELKHELILKSAIESYLINDMGNNRPEIQRVNFNYFIQKSNPLYVKFSTGSVVGYNYLFNYLMPLSIAWLIIGLFSLVTKYREQLKLDLIKTYSNLPIEIQLLLLYIGLGGPSAYYGFQFLSNRFNIIVIIIFAAFLYCVGISFFVYYLIFGIKSIFYDGYHSLVIQKSLLIRMLQLVKNSFTGVINWIIKSSNDVGDITFGKLILYSLSFFIIVSFIFLFLGGPYRWILILLLAIYVMILFYIAKRVITVFSRLNKESYIIAQGNYSHKIDLELPYFKTIQDNFNSIGDNLKLAVTEATQSERQKAELITNVSHDLKTPLTSIISYSGLLTQDQISDEDKREYVKIVMEKSLRLKHLIDDLFEVSMYSGNKIALNKENIMLCALLQQVIGEWEDKLEECNIQVLFDIPDKPVEIFVDPHKIQRVIDNLFSNILKYSMTNSRAYINVKKEGDRAVLSIKSMSKYELNVTPEELMERFSRGDRSRHTEGSGLGLSIARSLVEAHGGEFIITIDGDLFKTDIVFYDNIEE